jgi:leucine dehydrogenase
MAVAVAAVAHSKPASIEPVGFDHEQLVVRRGERSGLYCVVAVHSTVLGPALGGLRLWSYAEVIDAARDALRLAGGMTYKAAAAGLDLGGGKGVICAPPGGLPGSRRRAPLLDFGDLVESLGGRYITAEDVGIAPADLVAIAERTCHVTGLPAARGGAGDPSPFTAIGVEAAIRACLSLRFGDPTPAGRTVAIVGLGHVGARLAERLSEQRCELLVSDVLAEKRAFAERLGATWVDPEDAITVECDVLAPCALGGAIRGANVDRLRCEIVCGSANNQLADESLAERLAERGILFAPDFIANAGGLINVYREIAGYGRERAAELARGIETTIREIVLAADARGITPLEAAQERATSRLAAAASRGFSASQARHERDDDPLQGGRGRRHHRVVAEALSEPRGPERPT